MQNTPDSVFSLLSIMVAVEIFMCYTGYDLIDKMRNRVYAYCDLFPQIKIYVRQEISPVVTEIEKNLDNSYIIMALYLSLTIIRVLIASYSQKEFCIAHVYSVIDFILFISLAGLLYYILYIFTVLFGRIDQKIKTINRYMEYPF